MELSGGEFALCSRHPLKQTQRCGIFAIIFRDVLSESIYQLL